jgi:GDP-6-deoxy-D-talose 4-dehydrogenase
VATRFDDLTPRVLVTGLCGFTGLHLRPVLEAQGYEVHGIVAPTADGANGPAASSSEHVADLLDFAALSRIVAEVQPHHVIHLAAIAFVAHGDVDAMYRTNIVGTRHLLQALASRGRPSSVLLASSANVYGNADVDPIDEVTPAKPANDYAVSKLAMESMAALWTDRLPLTVVRPFNYTGVGQSEDFLMPKIVRAFRQRHAVLELGNTAVERDFCDVRDVATAYARLLVAAPGGVFNVCSGRAVNLASVLELAQGMTGHLPEIRVNPAFVRSNEVTRLRGSNARLRTLIPDWTARPLRETVAWMLSQ